jgi:ubiquinone/menaquinone biosynthesis C-methylase UbiE
MSRKTAVGNLAGQKERANDARLDVCLLVQTGDHVIDQAEGTGQMQIQHTY